MTSVGLNFHGVGPVLRTVDDGERHCWLTQPQLETILDLVANHPNINLTVDDGNASDVALILPALLKRRLKATFFICAGRLDKPTFLSQVDVRKLLACGMEIGCHGFDHISWRKVSREELDRELHQARRILQEVSNTPVNSAACPFGDYDRRVLSQLRKAGYQSVHTSDGGFCSPGDWIQPRNTVTQSTSLSDINNLITANVPSIKQVVIRTKSLLKRLR